MTESFTSIRISSLGSATRQKEKFLPILYTLFMSSIVSADPSNKFDAIYEDCLKKAGEINNNIVMACSEEISSAVKAEIHFSFK